MPEYAHLTRFFEPPQHAVVRDVAPYEVSPIAKPNGTLRPTRACIQPFDGSILLPILPEPGIHDFNGRVRILYDFLAAALFFGPPWGTDGQTSARCRRSTQECASFHDSVLLSVGWMVSGAA